MYTSENVSIIIPNWNGEEILKKYFQSVVRSVGKAEIILVDDVSEDNSVEYIRNNFSNVIILQKTHHEGFSGTVNFGVARATRDIIVLLNTDVVPDRYFLRYILPHFEDISVFAVGCLEESKEDGRIVLRGRGEAEWKKGMYVHRRGEVDKNTTAWVSGGSGAFRRSLWDKLGGLDPLFNPFYWEDIDISYRALKAGYNLVFEKRCIVKHFHSVGAIRSQFTATQVRRIAYRNQFIFIWKNVSDISLIFSHCLWISIGLVKALVRGDFDFIIGFFQALSFFRRIFYNRIQNRKFWKLADKDLQLT